jgi:hypothetical protein
MPAVPFAYRLDGPQNRYGRFVGRYTFLIFANEGTEICTAFRIGKGRPRGSSAWMFALESDYDGKMWFLGM